MKGILEKLIRGEISIEEAEHKLKILAIEEISEVARIDIHRAFRKGIPEVVLSQTKTTEDTVKIALKMLEKSGRAILSRVSKKHVEALKKALDKYPVKMDYNKKAKMILIRREDFQLQKTGGKIGIITAGTSDIPVAEEAKMIAEQMGCEVLTAYDVGVAGLHRLFPSLKTMLEKKVSAIVVVAGMEGALPSVVTGLIDIPVIGVPTSSGYGLGGGGVGALISMLQSCSPGLSVVNIDNGVAAGAVAAMIANQVARASRGS